MKTLALTSVFAALVLSAAATASAEVHVSVGVTPFVFGGYLPPVVYQPAPYYAPPPVVYLGGGSWGDRRRGHERDRRDRGHERDRPDHDRPDHGR
jgi:hypothetical protein